jgi:hypothetical protein
MGCIIAHNDEECNILAKIYGEKRIRYFDIFIATERRYIPYSLCSCSVYSARTIIVWKEWTTVQT